MGLSDAEAEARLQAEGPNELPSARPRSILTIAFEVVREPMFLLLIASGTVYLFLGDLREALALLGAVFLVVGITLYQEQKTERALQALRDLSSPRALVVRGGVTTRIPGRNVVRGDILSLHEGDRVPADAIVLSATSLSVDESLLTGESVPVRKVGGTDPTAAAGAAIMEPPGGEDRPFVFSGTLVIRGQGFARVLATGAATELGKIGRALSGLGIERTSLQVEVGRLVRILAVLGLSACVLVAVVYGWTRGQWLDGVLAGLTMAISMVPEEFPVILTVFLALGAWRISRSHVLTRRVPAIETLGSATVLCVDKTGTLTMNRMSVAALDAGGDVVDVSDNSPDVPEPFRPVVEYGVLASKPDGFDPMERALVDLGARLQLSAPPAWTLAREYPLAPDLLAMTQVWAPPAGADYVVAAKGAPEAIAELARVEGAAREALLQQVDAMANRGLRVLGIARGRIGRATTIPESARAIACEFVGLVGMADPVRPGVPAAIEECYAAGIRVVMITGDYPNTARSIARQIGLAGGDVCLTGAELRDMDDAALQQRAASVNIFARMVPEQKLRLVGVLKTAGEIVAMTGDGVNDAPALKAAHIGIAMGGRGTDVAREAAALVLLDDDFSSIVRAVRQGRSIYANIEKAMAYVLAIHVPIAGASLIPVMFGWPLILMPVHVIFMELIIDPACSIAFEMEPEDADVMRQPPRRRTKRLFETRMVVRSLLQGTGGLAAVLVVFGVALRELGELDARTLAFATLIFVNLALIFTNRSSTRTIVATWRSPNPVLMWLVGGAAVVLAAAIYVPFLRELFSFSVLHPPDLFVCFAASGATVVWMETVKRLTKRGAPARR